ncbi:hypothetical protein L7F22_030446 [Adiantum nelumboides]|nr:hypothetical protein [Adiantum nelumboides]
MTKRDTVDAYCERFWSTFLPVSSFKKISFRDQIERFTLGLLTEIQDHCLEQKSASIQELMSHAKRGFAIHSGGHDNMFLPNQKNAKIFLHTHADCFSEDLPGELPPARPEDHYIDLIPRRTPPNRPPYRVSQAQNEAIMNQVKDLLEKGLIQPNSSPYCFPVMLVLKNETDHKRSSASEINFLGHIVSTAGVQKDPAKIDTIRDWPDWKNVHEVESFLGLCSYYRRYVRKFVEIASPLHMLTQKEVPFSWGATEVTSFQTLKDNMTTGPISILPDLQKSFEVYCDACGRSLGAVLMQDGRVIAYESRLFSKPEMTAQIYEKELLAVIQALTQWQHYLLGADFTVFTDHQSLYYLSQKQLLEQRMRWANILSQSFISRLSMCRDTRMWWQIANSVVLDLLKSCISDQKTQWERYLPLVEFA